MITRFKGNLTASYEAVPDGRLYYRHLEWCKALSLDMHNHNYDMPSFISAQAREEITWWIENVENSFAYIQDIPDIDKNIYTDASKHLGGGWGASDDTHGKTNGKWSIDEQELSINYLELKAIQLALLSSIPLYGGCKHVRVLSDNTTAISYINKKGYTLHDP